MRSSIMYTPGMSQGLPPNPAESYVARRRALGARIEGPALVFSGVSRPINYPANVFPFRPDSHFLYLTGAWLEHAALLVDGERDVLYMPPYDAEDAIWHGPSPSWDDFQAATGVAEVRDIAELGLGAAVLSEGVSTIPAVDPVTRFRQGRLLGRAWAEPGSPVELGSGDAALADALIELRMIHDPAAITMLRGAAEATVAAHRAGMAATRPGLRESDVRAAMEAELLARDMNPAYGSIVTVHGEILHSRGYQNPIAAGDLLLADVGASNRGWAGDVTRTWPVSGKFSPTQRAMYELVLAAQLAAIERVRPGARYRDIHLAASLVIARGLVDEGILKGDPEGLVERGAHALFFVHGLGHMLGLDVHDMEDLGDRAGYAPGRTRSDQFGLGFLRLDRDLEAGMAVTIEPGFYQVPALLAPGSELSAQFDRDGTLDRAALAKFADVRGIRIEDDVLVTAAGHEVLTEGVVKRADQVEDAVGAG
jgi:Xaa-Pro aminopeptidase